MQTPDFEKNDPQQDSKSLQPPLSDNDLFNEAWQFLNKNDYQAAVIGFKQAAKQDDYPPAYVMVYMLYSNLGMEFFDHKIAQIWENNIIEKLIVTWLETEVNKKDPLAMFLYGYIHEKGIGIKIDLNIASKYYHDAFAKRPDKEFIFAIGRISLDLTLHPQAINEFKHALSIDKGFWRAQLNLAITYAKLKKNQDAIDYLKPLTKIRPKIGLVWLNWIIALTNHNQKQAVSACSTILSELEKNARHNTVIYWKIKSCAEKLRGNLMDAVICLDHSLLLKPKCYHTEEERRQLIERMLATKLNPFHEWLACAKDNFSTLNEFNISDYKISPEDIKKLADFINDKETKAHTSNIVSLQFNRNNLMEEHLSALRKALAHNTRLTQIDFGDNPVAKHSSANMLHIHYHLLYNKEIVSAAALRNIFNFDRLSCNDVSKLLKKHATLTELDFSKMQINENSILLNTKSYFTMPALTHLNFKENLINNEALNNLLTVLSHEPKIFPLLETIDLSDNQITSAGLWDIIEKIKLNKLSPSIAKILLKNNEIIYTLEEETLHKYNRVLHKSNIKIDVSGNMLTEIKDLSILIPKDLDLSNSSLSALGKIYAANLQWDSFETEQKPKTNFAQKKIFEKLGFTYNETPQQGNGFYKAISDQLYQELKLSVASNKLALLSASHICENFQFYNKEDELEAFIKRLNQAEECSHSTQITAMGRVLNVNLVIIHAKNKKLNSYRCSTPLTNLYLGLDDAGYYRSLTMIESREKQTLEYVQQLIRDCALDNQFTLTTTLEQLRKICKHNSISNSNATSAQFTSHYCADELKQPAAHSTYLSNSLAQSSLTDTDIKLSSSPPNLKLSLQHPMSFFYSTPSKVKSRLAPYGSNVIIDHNTWYLCLSDVGFHSKLVNIGFHYFILLEGLLHSGQRFIEKIHIVPNTAPGKGHEAIVTIVTLTLEKLAKYKSTMKINHSQNLSSEEGKLIQQKARQKPKLDFSILNHGQKVNCRQWCDNLLTEAKIFPGRDINLSLK